MNSILSVPRRRLATLIVLPALALLPVWAGARLVLAMRAEAPVREAMALRSALDKARRARAREFAAPDLKIAEAAVEQAMAEYYRTVSEKTGFARYDLVRKHLVGAHEKVTWAWSRARQRTDASRDYARRMIDEGAKGVFAAEQALAGAPIGSAVRASLARARVSVASAAARWRRGDYDAATVEATSARAVTEDIRRRARSFVENYSSSAPAKQWVHWVRETIDLSRRTGEHALVVDKLKHRCYLYKGGSLVNAYAVDMGGTIQDKMRAGDRATPEGRYRIIQKKGPGQTETFASESGVATWVARS